MAYSSNNQLIVQPIKIDCKLLLNPQLINSVIMKQLKLFDVASWVLPVTKEPCLDLT